jgi:hypothetical protein
MNDHTKDVVCLRQWWNEIGYPHGKVPLNMIDEEIAVRERLWKRHYESLSAEDKALVDSDAHPFFDAERYPQAVEFAKPFIEKVSALDYVKSASVDYYHGDSLVITVIFNRALTWQETIADVPEFYRGAKVISGYPTK